MVKHLADVTHHVFEGTGLKITWFFFYVNMYYKNLILTGLDKNKFGLEWWLTPVIPALRGAEVGGSPEVKSSGSVQPTW